MPPKVALVALEASQRSGIPEVVTPPWSGALSTPGSIRSPTYCCNLEGSCFFLADNTQAFYILTVIKVQYYKLYW